MDKGKQITVRNDLGGRSGRGCNNIMTSDAFISRSDLKILLHDSDPENCDEISILLTKCSYEGTVSFFALDRRFWLFLMVLNVCVF